MRRKKGYSMLGRSIAFLLLIISLIAIPAGAMGTYYLANEGFYIAGAGGMKDNYLDDYFVDLGRKLLERVYAQGERSANEMIKKANIYYVVTTPGGETLGNYDEGILKEWSKVYTYNDYEAGGYSFAGVEEYSIEMIVPIEKKYPDYIALVCFTTNNAGWLMVVLPAMALLGVVAFLGSATYLLSAAGWNHKEEKQTSGVFGKIPTDIFTIIAVGIEICLLEYFWSGRFVAFDQLKKIVGMMLMIFVGVLYLMSMAARAKAGNLWSHSVLGWLYRKLAKLVQMCREVVRNVPGIWKTVAVTVAVSALELAVLIFVYQAIPRIPHDRLVMRIVILLWALEKLILFFVIFNIMLKLRELQVAGQELAAGNSGYKVDTTLMFGAIKEHGENLNRISEGVTKAVNERMKSEHLKTELITNVSHDIKTPLTSIINYSDLIEKEETDNEKIKEYSEVLHRQSTRLKKLIEDLVDASKASTGNVEVNLEVCDVGVLLEQASGEFAQRMFDKSIDLVSKQPENPVQIMADPKLLWRVFDNLMNNICKYAQSGTRVYLAVEEQGNKAVISFKNISEYPLDISADELMERFVRGDRSRHTEGNGLGLSIAKSLTELQNGTLELVIDGDLFKVLLSFPTNA